MTKTTAHQNKIMFVAGLVLFITVKFIATLAFFKRATQHIQTLKEAFAIVNV